MFLIKQESGHFTVLFKILTWLLSDSEQNPNFSPWTPAVNVEPHMILVLTSFQIFHTSVSILSVLQVTWHSNCSTKLLRTLQSLGLCPVQVILPELDFATQFPGFLLHFFQFSFHSFITIVAFPDHFLNTISTLTLLFPFYIIT